MEATNNDLAAMLAEAQRTQNESEYQRLRERIVRENKLREGGYDPDYPYALPKMEWRALCALFADDAWKEYGFQFYEDLFTDPQRRNVFKVMRKMGDEGIPMDIQAAYTIFERMGLDFPIGWIEWLTSTTHMYHLPYMLKELSILHQKRKLDNTFKAATALMESGDISLDTVNERLKEVMDKGPVEDVATLADAGAEVLKTIRENATLDRPIGTHTGFKMFDELGGFMAGDLIVLAGDTSNGKTSLALSITLNAILERNKIAYYSMEMPKKRLASRLLSILSKIPSTSMLRKRLYQEDYDAVKKALYALPSTELLFDDKATIRFDDLLGSIRSMASKYKVQGVVVDYLQILNVNNKSRDTQERLMAEAARKLKNVAMECNIWVMALSQLSRDKNNPEPTLARLRDSGQIAEAADEVILVYRPELYNRPYSGDFAKKDTENTAQIEIAKGRDIGLGKCLVGFNPALTYFYDAEIGEARADNIKHSPYTPSAKLVVRGAENNDDEELPF